MVDNPFNNRPEQPITTPVPVMIVAPPSNGLAIAAMVTGIVAFILAWLPFLGFILGLIAIVLGIIALKKPAGKAMAIAGLATGGVAVIWNLIVTAFIIITFTLYGSAASQAASQAFAAYNVQQHTKLVAKKDFAKGTTAVFDKFSIKANSIQRNYVPPGQTATTTGKELIIVNLTIKNISPDAISFGPSDLNLNVSGVVVDSSYLVVAPALSSVNLASGATYSGNIIYQIDQGASNLKLQYQEPFDYTASPGIRTLTYSLAI